MAPGAKPGCQIKDLLGKTVPAGGAGTGKVESAPARSASRDLFGDHDQCRSNLAGGGGTTPLISDDSQHGPLRPEPQHCFDEVCTLRSVYPGGAEDDVMSRSRPHSALTRFLAAPVDAQRVDLI